MCDQLLQIDDEMERHSELLKEVQDSPTDVGAVVACRRKDFTGEFFSYITTLSETYDSLEDRDGNYHKFANFNLHFAILEDRVLNDWFRTLISSWSYLCFDVNLANEFYIP